MGKRAKQSDPLGARASGVEKTKLSRAELPSWYYRLMSIRGANTSFDETDPRDFDEDLSELEEASKEESEESEEEECECDSEDECDCRLPDADDSSDDESETSYDGSDADFYYDLKEEREKRKRQKLAERKDKDRQLEVERSKEEEVRDAEKSLKKVQRKGKKIATLPPPVKSIAGQDFRLFSSDHVDHFYASDGSEDKYVEFSLPNDMPKDDGSDTPDEKSSDDTGKLCGRFFYDGQDLFEFGPFFPPDSATLRPMKVNIGNGTYKLSLHFLGNGYLKLGVPRDVVFMGWEGESPAEPPPDGPAPKVFEFVGIWADPSKEEEEREKMEKERGRNRSPSPRETWFELNHPMGAYYDPRYSVDW